MYRNLFIILILAISGWGCRSLPMGGPEAAAPPPPLPKAEASVNLSMEIPLSFLEDQINKSLDKQLFNEKDLEFGDGLYADVDLKKTGQLNLTAQKNGNILLGLPVFLDGEVRLEKRLFGQRIATAIPFQENLKPQISFLPVLKENWAFDVEGLDIQSWGKALEYDLLGFKIDFEPMVKRQMVSIMESQLRSGALEAIDFKQIADKFWTSFSRPRYVENGFSGSYIYPHPEKLRVHDTFTPDQMLQLNFGLEGEMRSQKDRPLATQLSALPGISLEQVDGNHLSITTPLIIGFEEISDYLSETLKDSLIALDSKTGLLPKDFTVRHYAEKTMITMDFLAKRTGKKDLEGKFYLAGSPVYDPEIQAIRLENVAFRLETDNFFANMTNWMRRRKIMKIIQKQGVIPVADYLENARLAFLEMGDWQTAFATFKLVKPEISISGIYPSTTDLVIYVKTQADIQMEWDK